MLALHGSWLPGRTRFCLWAEKPDVQARRRGRKAAVPPHPFAAPAEDLAGACKALSLSLNALDPPETIEAWLPAAGGQPQPSPELLRINSDLASEDRPGELARFLLPAQGLTPLTTLDALLALPRPAAAAEAGVVLGADLRFWSAAAKLAVALLAGQRYLPGMLPLTPATRYRAVWQPVLDEPPEAGQIAALVAAMPPVCRALAQPGQRGGPENALGPRALLTSFLETVVDRAVRAWLPAKPPKPLTAGGTLSAGQAWLAALHANDPTFSATPAALAQLHEAWRTWLEQLHIATGQGFRILFRVEPPETPTVPTQRAWGLRYFLQATDDLSLLVPAEAVWQARGSALNYLNRRFEGPQERLLAGLGLAARLCPPVEASLRLKQPEVARLTTDEAYNFLREIAPLLESSGFGILAPPWWNKRGAASFSSRLKLKPKAAPKSAAPGKLTFDALVDFDWQLALGGEEITPEEFRRLADLKTSLVQIRGEWVVLDPDAVDKAIKFWEDRRNRGEVTLLEALRLALDGAGPEGLAVDGVDAADWLEPLLTDLAAGEKLPALPAPPGFQGDLRPYQGRGVAWLWFLRRFGLGACLADDMGLGKCLAPDSLVAVNGTLRTVEALWDSSAQQIQFDGEGFWAVPSEKLVINALDEASGRIVATPIKRFYRQRVQESLRRVTLEDGSSVTITSRHQLLTSKGWTNDLRVGDYVCVPAQIPWDGQPEDADLVQFLAWQIAEGHEDQTRAYLAVTQKDAAVLEDLLAILQRIGERYHLKINQPIIRIPTDRTPDLRLNSVAYRQFLETRGYVWGRLSREKVIPPFIMQADRASIRLFLRNYFDAEADVAPRMRSIEISTASPTIIQQLSTLLRRFGIWLRVSAKQKCATNGTGIFRTYYFGVIGGTSARRFLQAIGFGKTEKQRRLEEICEHISNTNVEGIPASEVVAETVETAGLPLRHLGMYNTVYVNGSQQFSRASLAKVVSALDRVLSGESERGYRQLKPSKWTSRTLDAYTRLDTARLEQTREHLQWLLDQEVFYCRIKTIEDIVYDGWVYDLEVENHHNFVANNILCHNTIQAAALLLHVRAQGAAGPALVICPTSVVGNWQREMGRFAPELKVLLHHGSDRLSDEAFVQAAAEHDLVVSSFGLLRRDAETFNKVHWSAVVLDEAQNIKNPETRQAQLARKLPADYRIALTGTPVENRLSDLWSIMQFLNPGYLGSQRAFRQEFVIPVERYGDADAAARLRRLVQPFVLRRLKTDPTIISDLPEKNEMKVYCPLTPEQATLYEAVVKDTLEKVESSEGIERRGLVLAMLMKLKQVCNHPAHFLGDGSALAGRSGKLARLVEMLEEVQSIGDRALVFTQFYEMGEMLRKHLGETLGGGVLFLHGGTPQKQRERMIASFQAEAGGPGIFILSLKAGGTGLNLTRANHVFHFDRWWNPAVENQATDRTFRIGQRRDVQVHKFVCLGTLEERIDDLIESKRALAENVLGTGEGWLTELSTDQLRDLLTLRRDAVAE